MDSANLTLVVKSIVTEQFSIMGPLAIEEANKVAGLHLSTDLKSVEASGDSNQILTNLVHQYEKLFGKASIEACRDSVKQILPQLNARDLPQFLL